MLRSHRSLPSLMLAISLAAICFAVFGAFAGGVMATAVTIVMYNPCPLRWGSLELVAAWVWLAGVIRATSEVTDDYRIIMLSLLPGGLVLGISWVLRLATQPQRLSFRREWATLIITPAVGLLAMFLWITDLDFQVRLILSEPALRSEACRMIRYHKGEICDGKQVGLFEATKVEEREGHVLWYMSAEFFWVERGLVYLPNGRPLRWNEYSFQHVRGKWYRFRRLHD